MIAIIDYGMGNLRSVAKAVERFGGEARIARTGEEILAAAKVILPGVGAFQDAMDHLHAQRLAEPIREVIGRGTPLLGICLGLQLLFETGYEDGEHKGLGVLPGKVVRFDFRDIPGGEDLAIPHMGWNALTWRNDCPLLGGIQQGSYVYFVHSYHPVPDDPEVVLTETEYGYRFTSGIRRDNLYAVQFHPEKSQAVGLRIIRNFVTL